MRCDKCGAGLKLRRSYSNGKREVWTCQRKDCEGREEIDLWQRQLIRDAAMAVEIFGENELERYAREGV